MVLSCQVYFNKSFYPKKRIYHRKKIYLKITFETSRNKKRINDTFPIIFGKDKFDKMTILMTDLILILKRP